MSNEVVVSPQVITVQVSNSGPQGPAGSFDGFTVEGGNAFSTYLNNQIITGGNAV